MKNIKKNLSTVIFWWNKTLVSYRYCIIFFPRIQNNAKNLTNSFFAFNKTARFSLVCCSTFEMWIPFHLVIQGLGYLRKREFLRFFLSFSKNWSSLKNYSSSSPTTSLPRCIQSSLDNTCPGITHTFMQKNIHFFFFAYVTMLG